MADDGDDGAKPGEILIEAARRNNVELLDQVFKQVGGGEDGEDSSSEKISELINSTRDPLGNTPLHIAALNGSYEVLDELLDVAGVEVDPRNRLEGDTPLHCGVRYAEQEPEHGTFIVDTLIDAGCDARIRNKAGQKPIDLAPMSNEALRKSLESGEMAMIFGPSVGQEEVVEEDQDQGGDETPSDSESEEQE